MIRTLGLKTWGGSQPSKGLLVIEKLLGVPDLGKAGQLVWNRFQQLRRQRGLAAAILHFKEARWVLIKNLIGDPVLTTPVKRDRYGFPQRELPVSTRQRLRDRPTRMEKATAILLLSVYTLYKGAVAWRPNLEAITAPCSADLSKVQGEWVSLLPSLLLKLGLWELKLRAPSPIVSNRAGPNGHALLATHLDAIALQGATGTHLRAWLALWPSSKTSWVRESISNLRNAALANLGDEAVRTLLEILRVGRVGLKPEHGKVRPFAIVDYFTQVVLSPLHEALFGALRALPMDATFHQGGGAQKVQQWTEENRRLWSYDLSSATDRFPVLFQAFLLEHLLRGYGKGFGFIWQRLLTDREFDLRGKPIRYRVGQPMGALSSWAVFALSHHVVVQWAAVRAGLGKVRFTEYVLLGDDLVIANEAVALAYVTLMESLGVSINRSKSVVGVGIAEFAKRTFYRGSEVTGLWWDLASEAGKGLVSMRALLEHLSRRGFKVSLPGLLSLVLGAASLSSQIGSPVQNFLASVVGPNGPLPNLGFWWLLRQERLVGPLLSAADTVAAKGGIHTAEEEILTKVVKDHPVWKMGQARLLLDGIRVLDLWRGNLDSYLYQTFEKVWTGSRKNFRLIWDQAAIRRFVKEALPWHPARMVLEMGFREPSTRTKFLGLRVVARADTEERQRLRQSVRFSMMDLEAIVETFNSLEVTGGKPVWFGMTAHLARHLKGIEEPTRRLVETSQAIWDPD